MTILSFIAVFAGMGLGSTHTSYASALLLVSGIILGSAFWWLLLSSVTALLHHRINSNMMRVINWVAGGIILIFGLIALKVFL